MLFLPIQSTLVQSHQNDSELFLDAQNSPKLFLDFGYSQAALLLFLHTSRGERMRVLSPAVIDAREFQPSYPKTQRIARCSTRTS